MLVRHSNDIIMLAPQLIVAEAELEKVRMRTVSFHDGRDVSQPFKV